MKCDHLIGRKFDGEVYILASDVIEAVAELKAKLNESEEARYEAGADAADYYLLHSLRKLR